MNNSELYHHGIKGQKWGVRRFRKQNGSLTNIGKRQHAEIFNAQKSKLAATGTVGAKSQTSNKT